MKKNSNVSELVQERDIVERKIRNFSNMDLSHLDLSKFKPKFWENAIFYNTNLSNTGIRFNPEKLGMRTIEKCNFENVDLSYIKEKEWVGFTISDAILRNTGATINISYCNIYCDGKSVGDIILDESYADKPIEYWDTCNIDFSTLKVNPFIHITPYKLFILIQVYIEKKCIFLTQNQIINLVEQCEKFLEEYDDGTLTRLYKLVCRNFNYLDKLKFFQGRVEGKVYQNLIFNDSPINLLEMIHFSNCSFEKMELDNKLKKLLNSRISFFSQQSNNSFKCIELSDLNLNSWKNLNTYSHMNQLGTISFKRFLYLELGMSCNCNCTFCRNKSFNEKCEERNISRILTNLEIMKEYVDSIFIGGGEPTLYVDDILKIYEKQIQLVIVTNGTVEKKTLDKIGARELRLNLYISRHAISDEENYNILEPRKSCNILSLEDIKEIAKRNIITFTPVCVKGGLDSSQKIIRYIAVSFEYGVKNIIISTLHKDASMGKKEIDNKNLYVDQNILDDVFSMLLAQGFRQKRTICSTGGYILKRFVKDYNYTVSFKIYITKEQFPKYWGECVKKTFDFTMTSNGDVYQDWCREELVNLEEMKALTKK